MTSYQCEFTGSKQAKRFGDIMTENQSTTTIQGWLERHLNWLTPGERKQLGISHQAQAVDLLQALVDSWRGRGASLEALAEANEALQDKLCEVMEVTDANG